MNKIFLGFISMSIIAFVYGENALISLLIMILFAVGIFTMITGEFPKRLFPYSLAMIIGALLAANISSAAFHFVRKIVHITELNGTVIILFAALVSIGAYHIRKRRIAKRSQPPSIRGAERRPLMPPAEEQ